MDELLKTIGNTMMNKKRLLILTIMFFVIENTYYLFEGLFGILTYPILFLLLILFLYLSVQMFIQFIRVVKEKLADKQRLYLVCTLLFALTTYTVFPSGVVSYIFDSKDVFVAFEEGSANCTVTLKLKKNGDFVERSACFGVTKITGTYVFRNDTVFFQPSWIKRISDDEYYKFGVITNVSNEHETQSNKLILYQNYSDTSGCSLRILKNELNQ